MNAINFEAKKLGLTVDALGKLKAKIARLKKAEKELETELKEFGVAEVDGKTFRCTISEICRTTVDYKSICTKLKASPYMLETYSKTNDSVRLTVKAHKKA